MTCRCACVCGPAARAAGPRPSPAAPAPLPPAARTPAADSQGRTVDFKNTLIILTSNVGSSVIAKGGAGVGFQLATEGQDPAEGRYARVRSLVLEELKVGAAAGCCCWAGLGWAGVRAGQGTCRRRVPPRDPGHAPSSPLLPLLPTPLRHHCPHPHPRQAYFRPELLNRMDEVVVFRQLGQPEVGGPGAAARGPWEARGRMAARAGRGVGGHGLQPAHARARAVTPRCARRHPAPCRSAASPTWS